MNKTWAKTATERMWMMVGSGHQRTLNQRIRNSPAWRKWRDSHQWQTWENKGEGYLKRKWEAHFGVLNCRCPYGPQGDTFSGCYNRSVLHSRLDIEIKVEGPSWSSWKSKPWEGMKQLREVSQSRREHGKNPAHVGSCPSLCTSKASDANFGKRISSQIFSVLVPFVVLLNQAWGLPSSALDHFQSLASPTLEYSYQPLTTLPSPPSDLHPWRAASLGWVLIPRWAWGSFWRDQPVGGLSFDPPTTPGAPSRCSQTQPGVSDGNWSARHDRRPPQFSGLSILLSAWSPQEHFQQKSLIQQLLFVSNSIPLISHFCLFTYILSQGWWGISW